MYKIPDPKQTSVLHLRRHGWFSLEYELTDETNSYGKLLYNFISKRRATAITATGTWTFGFEGIFNSNILITDESGIVIGKVTRDWFSRKRFLTMQTGFQAEFYRPVFFWLWNHIWDSPGYGKIMRIKSSPLNIKTTIYLDQSMTPVALIPLLIFLGAHLAILRRRRRGVS